MSIGRPSMYSQEIATRICEGIVAGRGLRSICKDDGMPEPATVFNWLAGKKHPEFVEQYAHAREVQAELMADEINEIADDGTNDFMERARKDGQVEVVVDHENINRSRLRVDARKWAASKLLPKKYGDKVAVTGKDGGPVVFTLERVGS